MSNFGFVLGNGVSRQGLDVNQLLQLGPVYGCNALYRTHVPTVLVATDYPISERIQEAGFANKTRFYTRKPMPNTGALTVPRDYYGFSSGPIALAIAALDGIKQIYFLGFDMGPTHTGRFNNVYADTEFYKKMSSTPTYTGNWTKQMKTVFQNFPTTQFTRVYGTTTADIKDFEGIANLNKLLLNDFVNRINIGKDL